MSLIDALRYRLRVWLHPARHARELEEEIRFHLALEALQREQTARSPLQPPDALDAARRRLGNATLIKEEVRMMSGLGFFDLLRQDLCFAWRGFRRTPGFTAIAVLTLALGIGANTAIFSTVRELLLRPLPFKDPDQLMIVSLTVPARGESPARGGMVWSYPKFTVLRDNQTVFQDLALTTELMGTLRVDGETERIYLELAGERYLPVLSISPLLGRNFLPEEDRAPGGPKVALLSWSLWQRRFNADPKVLGTTVSLDGDPYSVIGVMPRTFKGTSGRSELLIPILSQSPQGLGQAWSHAYTLLARRKPGVSVAAARAQVQQLGPVVDRAYPHPEIATEAWGADARAMDALRVDPTVRRSVLVLFGAVALVLLIACANVANLFLVRAAGRRREIAVRLAIGAGRRRLVRQLLTEAILLALMGGLASLIVAWVGVRVLANLDAASALRLRQPGGIGTVSFSAIHLDLVTLGFAAGLALATGVLFGLIPALQSTRPSVTEALKEGSSGRGGKLRISGRNLLAGVEIALALVLLSGAGLTLRSLAKLLAVDPGFAADHLLTVRVSPATARDSLPQYFDQVLERLGALPGVTGVGLTDCPPLNGGCNGTIMALRDRPPVAMSDLPETGVHWVTPSWFATARVPLIQGRNFDSGDRLGTRKVVLVNQAAARKFWPNEDPIGRPVSVGQGGFWPDTAYVVGVVGDVRYGTVDSLPQPEAYLSFYQSPRSRMMVFLRIAGDPVALAPAARRALQQIAPDAPVYDIRTMASRAADAIAYARFSALLLALFAAVALGLAVMGTYGVMSFAVAQRTREIGIRVALGAGQTDVVRMVVGQGVAIGLAGALVGLLAALGLTRVLQSLLFNISPTDPATFAAIILLLGLAVVLASWLPARRAAAVHPTQALREE